MGCGPSSLLPPPPALFFVVPPSCGFSAVHAAYASPTLLCLGLNHPVPPVLPTDIYHIVSKKVLDNDDSTRGKVGGKAQGKNVAFPGWSWHLHGTAEAQPLLHCLFRLVKGKTSLSLTTRRQARRRRVAAAKHTHPYALALLYKEGLDHHPMSVMYTVCGLTAGDATVQSLSVGSSWLVRQPSIPGHARGQGC